MCVWWLTDAKTPAQYTDGGGEGWGGNGALRFTPEPVEVVVVEVVEAEEAYTMELIN